jgi:hypothetical protein
MEGKCYFRGRWFELIRCFFQAGVSSYAHGARLEAVGRIGDPRLAAACRVPGRAGPQRAHLRQSRSITP